MEEKSSSSKPGMPPRVRRPCRGHHGDADMSGLERRGVVDTVAGHGYDFAICLEGHHDAQLLFGNDAGKYLHILDLLRQVLVGHTL